MVGWSGWSPVSYVRAARRPNAPQPVTIVRSDSSSVTLKCGQSIENGGASVTSYTLWRD